MWIVYRKKDRAVVGMSASGETDLDREAALSEVVRGLVGGAGLDKYDAVQVTDPGHASALLSAPLRHLVVGGEPSRGRPQVSVEKPDVAFLLLRCDAADAHPVDGMPEIKADGKSFATIAIQKVDERGELRKSRGDNDELFLRATAGTLLGADGREGVNRIKLKQGEASFRLVSEAARRVAIVTVLSANPELHNTSIAVEFA